MALSTGTRLGPYEIQGAIGAGGMGEVYRAIDTSLGRQVAIKVLPEAFAQDAERLDRFEREARTLASLNHPNIAIIHGLEKADGIRALVMELVEGLTLAEQIAQGPIPVDQALPIAKQIAEAVEAAHEQGIIHRDLKPANVKVRDDGTVKVLDFGLAKAFTNESHTPSSAALTNSPTLTSPMGMTGVGVILGTAAYMAPEQAKGKPVTRATDIWAFGCVLYEMLTGRAAFRGEDVTEILAAVVRAEPDWSPLPAATPSGIRTLLRHCLHKNQRQRWQDAASLRIGIEDALAAPLDDVAGASDARRTTNRRWALVTAVTAVFAAAISGVAVWNLAPGEPAAAVSRLLVGVAPAGRLARSVGVPNARPYRTAIALSPDGQSLVFVGEQNDRRQLYLRTMARLDAAPIPGTENGSSPFFSPDGRWVGFWQPASDRALGELKKVPVGGGPAVTVCRTPMLWGASWGSHGRIVFANQRSGLWHVSEDGGMPEELTTVDTAKGEFSHRLPQVLPGGEAVLFTIQKAIARSDDAQIVVRSLVTGAQKMLVEGGTDARYVPSGHLVYARMGTLMAVPFDMARVEMTGGPIGILDDVMQDVNTSFAVGNSGAAQFSVSASGTLAYLPGGISADLITSPVWMDRSGTVQRLPVPRRSLFFPRLSPDGQRVAFTSTTGTWIYDIARGVLSQLTAEGLGGIWHPDGRRIALTSVATRTTGSVFWIAADGSGAGEPLTTSTTRQMPSSWSPDRKTLAFIQTVDESNRDIWLLSVGDGPARPRPFLTTSSDESSVEFSPDGRYLAYVSNESGRPEVYVQPYPGPGRKELVSPNGGIQPAWARAGRELFYWELGPDGTKMMAVDVMTRDTFTAARPRVLFTVMTSQYPPGIGGRAYDVTPDGGRFLMIRGEDSSEPPITQIVLVQNWLEELKRLVPTK